MTWGEVIRKLKKAGYLEHRTGKGSHQHFIHPATRHVITVSVHTKQESGELGKRLLREAGIR